MRIPGNLDQVSWYGRGPWENYADRKSSAFVGLYSTSVDDLYTPYTYEDLVTYSWGGKHTTDLKRRDFIDLNIDFKKLLFFILNETCHLPKREIR